MLFQSRIQHGRALLVIVLLSLVLTPTLTSAQVEQEPLQQMRAFWADSLHPGFYNYSQIDELVDNVVRANANTIFVEVRRQADAWYNNALDPRAARLQSIPPAEFDPLGYLLTRAHSKGISVHAWLVISVACRNGDPLQGNPNHVCTQHGPSTPDPVRWTTATYGGTQVGDLDFGHPAAVNYMESVVENLLHNYPSLDGIHYDYIRYNDQEYGYNQVSLARFRAAYALPDNYRPAPSNPAWSQWRRDRITELVRRLYIRIKAINPKVQVSAATITWGGVGSYSPTDWPNSAAYSRVFQDWAAWLQEGILDFAVPMHYFSEGDAQTRNWYDGWLNWDRAHTGRRAIVPGTGAWLNNPQEGIAQIQRALTPDAQGQKLAGVSLYSYDQPISNSNPEWRQQYMDLLHSSVFSAPARAPVWPWIAYPTTGHLQGIATIDGQPVPNAHISLIRNGTWVRDMTASIDGWYGAVDLDPGSYSVIIKRPSDGRTNQVNNLSVRAGMVMSA